MANLECKVSELDASYIGKVLTVTDATYFPDTGDSWQKIVGFHGPVTGTLEAFFVSRNRDTNEPQSPVVLFISGKYFYTSLDAHISVYSAS